MKKILFLFLILSQACASDDQNQPEEVLGAMGLSTREVNIQANGGSALIKAVNGFSWIHFVKADGEIFDVGESNVINGDWFYVEGKTKDKVIKVVLKPNTSDHERSVIVSLQWGNHFDGFIVHQSSKP